MKHYILQVLKYIMYIFLKLQFLIIALIRCRYRDCVQHQENAKI